MTPGSEDWIRKLAYSFYQAIGIQADLTMDYWLAAERIFWSAVKERLRHRWSQVTNEAVWAATFAQLRAELFQDGEYRSRVDKLASHMWEYAGRPTHTGLDFVTAAQKHAIAITVWGVNEAIATGDTVITILEEFSIPAHLERIREAAYYLWRERGGCLENPLKYWLEAESSILMEMQQSDFATKHAKSERE